MKLYMYIFMSLTAAAPVFALEQKPSLLDFTANAEYYKKHMAQHNQLIKAMSEGMIMASFATGAVTGFFSSALTSMATINRVRNPRIQGPALFLGYALSMMGFAGGGVLAINAAAQNTPDLALRLAQLFQPRSPE